jgi:hypothetical protein
VIIQGAAAPKKLLGKLSAVTAVASNTAPLKRKDVKTTLLGKVGWRILENSVIYIGNELTLHAAWDKKVVLHCLNRSCFMEKSGVMTLPCTGQDRLYHVLGKVVVAKGRYQLVPLPTPLFSNFAILLRNGLGLHVV